MIDRQVIVHEQAIETEVLKGVQYRSGQEGSDDDSSDLSSVQQTQHLR